MNPNKRIRVGELPERVQVLRDLRINPLGNSLGLNITRISSPVLRIGPWDENKLLPVGQVGQAGEAGPSCSEGVVETSRALTNDLVLDTIFDYLGFQDLLTCRSVSLKWAEVATLALVKRRTYISNTTLSRHVLFTAGNVGGSQNDENRVPQAVQLPMPVAMPMSTRVGMRFEELKGCMENSRNFPCAGIHLVNQTWGMSTKPVKQFLRLHGKRIRFLKLNFNFQRAKALSDLLLKYVPETEEIVIERVGNFARDREGGGLFGNFAEPVQLPTLKRISMLPMTGSPICPNSKVVCEELISAAKNLVEIKRFHPALTDAVIRAKKVHTISTFQFVPFTTQVEHMKRFAEAKPMLRRIDILEMGCISCRSSDAMKVASQALTGILESSKDTLQFMKTTPFRLLSDARFPVFSNLTTLVVVHPHDFICMLPSLPEEQHRGFFGFLPDGVMVSESFPRLKKVRLELHHCSFRDPFTCSINLGDIVHSAEVLEYSSPYTSRGMTILQIQFPNITHLVINWPKCFPQGEQRRLWLAPFRLKKLELYDIPFLWDKGPSSGNAMDSFFTGIPEAICMNLRLTRAFDINPAVLRTEPSLVCFKELVELKIRFSYEGLLGLRLLGKCPLISHVTGQYAFRMIPSLKVLILFDFHHPMSPEMVEALRPIAFYATFIHASSQLF